MHRSFCHPSRALAAAAVLLLGGIHVSPCQGETRISRDIEFARVGERRLQLDLYLPEGSPKSPLIVYVHGGGWQGGSKDDMPLGRLVGLGYAVASVDYRLSTEAKFPAQVHDLKAAVRYLRSHRADLGLPGITEIAIVGSSAGGHLAALVGVSNGVKELEGSVGADLKSSSEVQATISLFGASNLQSILGQSTPQGLKMRLPALQLLLGGSPEEKPALAQLASPVNHLDASDPPLLLIHGDADPQMPFAQSKELEASAQKVKAPVQLVTVAGGKHGGREFYDESHTALMANFLSRTVETSQGKSQVKKAPVPSEADVAYGAHPHQVLDIHLPPPSAAAPYPVLLWYGGLWKPTRNVPDLTRFLPQGIAVVAVGVRTYTDAAEDKVNPPATYVMNDAVRAVQFIRLNAAKWHLDPNRIAVGGGSQGALPALYTGCAPDRAKPGAADAVERVSSLVTCVAAYRSQPSIDPVQMQQWVPGVMWGAPALGFQFEESLKRREELLPVIRQWSPDALLHPGAAPIYFENNWGLEQPAEVSEMDYKVHSPAWGLGFQKLAQSSKVECHVKYPDHPTEGYADIWDFVKKKLGR